MAKGNINFKHLKREYVFPIIEKKLAELKSTHPNADILNLGIGDIALPIAPTIAKAIEQAVLTMSTPGQQVYGYGPSQGYSFLRDAIVANKYPFFSSDEVFISDGINTDITAILDLFDSSCTIAIPNPAYPAYLDSNLISGRKNKISMMPCIEETEFSPKPPAQKSDLIYLCSPHNPTGSAMTRRDLEEFVNYAKKNDAIILFDNAYEAFVTSTDVPKSIYEIPGAKDVALEFCSFSKSAGFTGLRCSYLVVPKTVTASFGKARIPLLNLWLKRQSIKFNGVAYPIQKGAEACFTPQGKLEIQSQINHYLTQAATLKKGLVHLGHTCFGGINSPYIWWKTPKNITSWEFFDILLKHCQLISVPGVGFGSQGEGFVRLSAFTSSEVTQKALEKIKQLSSYLP